MPYAQLDDRYHDTKKVRKVLRIEPSAIAIHVMAITFCNQHNTDGEIEFDRVEGWISLMPYRPARRQRVLDTLLQERLLEWREVGETLVVHDYLDWNRSSTSRLELAERGRRGGLAKAARSSHGSSRGSSPGYSQGHSRGSSQGSSTPRHATPSREKSTNAELRSAVGECFAYWQERCDHSQAKLTADRRTKLQARLREGYTVEQVRQAIDGAAVGAFVNDQGRRFDDLELICRSGSKLEDFIGRTATVVSLAAHLPEWQRPTADWDAQVQAHLDAQEKGA